MTICSNRFVYRIYKKVHKYINKNYLYMKYVKLKGVKYNKYGQKTHSSKEDIWIANKYMKNAQYH